MAYNMQDLLKKWAGEEMTVEQVNDPRLKRLGLSLMPVQKG